VKQLSEGIPLTVRLGWNGLPGTNPPAYFAIFVGVKEKKLNDI